VRTGNTPIFTGSEGTPFAGLAWAPALPRLASKAPAPSAAPPTSFTNSRLVFIFLLLSDALIFPHLKGFHDLLSIIDIQKDLSMPKSYIRGIV
jgi:hypothetical protein